MNTAVEILVVITSAVLVVFLVISIILVVQVLRVTSKIKKVAESGEEIAHNIERATKGFSKASTPLFFVNLLRGFMNGNTKKGKK